MEQLSFGDAAADEPSAQAEDTHLCECGCGQPTALITKTARHLGHIKGQYRRYRPGHNPLSGKAAPENDSYQAVHRYLLKHFPKTGLCEECGKPDAHTEHAVIHGHPYSRNREDYRELCHRCHMQYDLAGRPRRPEDMAGFGEKQAAAWARQREQGIERDLPRGAQHYRAKLTDALVAEILQKRAAGQSCLSLAREYRVSKKTILNIVHRKMWKHVPGEAVVPENMLRGPARLLADEQRIRGLHERYRRGETQSALARDVGVSQATLSRAFKRLGLEG